MDWLNNVKNGQKLYSNARLKIIQAGELVKSWRHQDSKAKVGKWCEIPQKKIKCSVDWTMAKIVKSYNNARLKSIKGFDFYFWPVLASWLSLGKLHVYVD